VLAGVRKVISNWYHGRTIISEPPFIGVRQERHWTAHWAHSFVELHRKEWKWFISVYLSIGLPFIGWCFFN
jgi:hypothetical protein